MTESSKIELANEVKKLHRVFAPAHVMEGALASIQGIIDRMEKTTKRTQIYKGKGAANGSK